MAGCVVAMLAIFSLALGEFGYRSPIALDTQTRDPTWRAVDVDDDQIDPRISPYLPLHRGRDNPADADIANELRI